MKESELMPASQEIVENDGLPGVPTADVVVRENMWWARQLRLGRVKATSAMAASRHLENPIRAHSNKLAAVKMNNEVPSNHLLRELSVR